MNISDLLDPEKMAKVEKKFRIKAKDYTREGKLKMKADAERDNASDLNNLDRPEVTKDFSDSKSI